MPDANWDQEPYARRRTDRSEPHDMIIVRNFVVLSQSALAGHPNEIMMYMPRTPNARPAIETGPGPYGRAFFSGQSAPPPVGYPKPGDPEPMAPGDVPDVPPSGLNSPT
jgi:hypothetical protein